MNSNSDLFSPYKTVKSVILMTQDEAPDQQTKDNWRNDPGNMKWGIFYYNKADKRIFPPKMYGVGWTVNFANPDSVGALIALVMGINLLVFGLLYYFVLRH